MLTSSLPNKSWGKWKGYEIELDCSNALMLKWNEKKSPAAIVQAIDRNPIEILFELRYKKILLDYIFYGKFRTFLTYRKYSVYVLYGAE